MTAMDRTALARLTDAAETVSAAYADEHGIDRTPDWLLLKLHEELGELTDAYLARTGRARDRRLTPAQLDADLADETADVLCHLLIACHHLGIDLAGAVERKWLARIGETATPAPPAAADAAERVQAFLDARPHDDRQGSHIVYTVPDPDRARGRWLHLTEPDLRELLAERDQLAADVAHLRAEDARTEKPSPHSDEWIINNLLFRARRCDANAASWDYPGVHDEAERRRYEAKRYRQLAAVARNVWAAADASEATATRPADGPAGAGESQRTDTPAQGAQQDAEGDGDDRG